MKNHTLRYVPILTIALALGVSPHLTAQVSPQVSPQQAQPGMPGNDQDKLRSYSFAERTEFAAAVREAALKLDERLAGLSANPAGAQPDERRAKAIEEAKDARTILEERLSKINQAIPQNWESVRDEVLTALAHVQTAYERLAIN